MSRLTSFCSTPFILRITGEEGNCLPFHDGLAEFIDNSQDAGATLAFMYIDKNKKLFTIIDNGKGMPRSEHYLNPSEQQAKPGSKVSGGFSYGAFAALFSTRPTVATITTYDGNKQSQLVCHISKMREKAKQYHQQENRMELNQELFDLMEFNGPGPSWKNAKPPEKTGHCDIDDLIDNIMKKRHSGLCVQLEWTDDNICKFDENMWKSLKAHIHYGRKKDGNFTIKIIHNDSDEHKYLREDWGPKPNGLFEDSLLLEIPIYLLLDRNKVTTIYYNVEQQYFKLPIKYSKWATEETLPTLIDAIQNPIIQNEIETCRNEDRLVECCFKITVLSEKTAEKQAKRTGCDRPSLKAPRIETAARILGLDHISFPKSLRGDKCFETNQGIDIRATLCMLKKHPYFPITNFGVWGHKNQPNLENKGDIMNQILFRLVKPTYIYFKEIAKKRNPPRDWKNYILHIEKRHIPLYINIYNNGLKEKEQWGRIINHLKIFYAAQSTMLKTHKKIRADMQKQLNKLAWEQYHRETTAATKRIQLWFRRLRQSKRIKRALSNFEKFKNMEAGTATLEHVMGSSARVEGWAAWTPSPPPSPTEPTGTPVSTPPSSPKGNYVVTNEELTSQHAIEDSLSSTVEDGPGLTLEISDQDSVSSLESNNSSEDSSSNEDDGSSDENDSDENDTQPAASLKVPVKKHPRQYNKKVAAQAGCEKLKTLPRTRRHNEIIIRQFARITASDHFAASSYLEPVEEAPIIWMLDRIAYIIEHKYTDTENVPFAELDNIIKDLDQ